MEQYEIMQTEDYTEEDLTFGDVALLLSLGFIACVLVCFLFRQIKSTFKNVHLKFGKLEVGIETKEEQMPLLKEKEEKGEKK
jgi:hypothetical protein